MPTTFLGCDGVLADFEGGAARVFGMRPSECEHRFGLKRFWATLASVTDFFKTLDLLPDVMELYEAVRPLNPVILTGLPRGGLGRAAEAALGGVAFPQRGGDHH
jgi:hypothetical protein